MCWTDLHWVVKNGIHFTQHSGTIRSSDGGNSSNFAERSICLVAFSPACIHIHALPGALSLTQSCVKSHFSRLVQHNYPLSLSRSFRFRAAMCDTGCSGRELEPAELSLPTEQLKTRRAYTFTCGLLNRITYHRGWSEMAPSEGRQEKVV